MKDNFHPSGNNRRAVPATNLYRFPSRPGHRKVSDERNGMNDSTSRMKFSVTFVVFSVRHIKATHPPEAVSGMWKKKMLWKPRWIKEWKSSNVLKPIWRKFWGPVIIREWVPIPKPPPQWQTTPVLPEPTPETSGTVISGLTQPPTPNLSYLPKPATFNGYSYDPPKRTYDKFKASGSVSGSFGYQAPYLPVSNGFGSQAETYRGYSSYGSGADAYDLNPPVDAFNPLLSDYSRKPPTGNYVQNGHASSPQPHAHPHPHFHHHHHHHKVRFTPHSHNQDLTKFPPDWSSWKPLPPHLHRPPPSLAQASSAVSVVSATTSTTPRQGAPVTDRAPFPVSESADDIIQQAALVSEFHYSEPASTESPSTKPPPIPSLPPVPEQEPSPRNPVRQPPPAPVRGPPARPSVTSPPRYQNAIPPQKYLKPSSSFPSNGSKPPPPFQLHKLPDFKALPTSSVATFHFVEGLPSNQTLTRAALIGNINRTASGNVAESNEVSILTPKPRDQKVAPHIVKLAQAVAEEHIKKTQNQKLNSSVTVQTTTDSFTTEKTPVTVVLPTTSSAIRKTLKDYLNDEANAVQTGNIFIVTPVPQKTDEN